MAARSAAFRKIWAGDGMMRMQSSTDTQAAASGSAAFRVRRSSWIQQVLAASSCENRIALIERGPARNARWYYFFGLPEGSCWKRVGSGHVAPSQVN
eukprot:1841555-Prymnesium_polylepis.1